MLGYLLIARDGNSEIARTVVTSAQAAAGRLEDCELVLSEPWVSRRHLIFTPKEGALRLDNVSNNPVFVNDVEMDAPMLLSPGDVIALGRFRIDVRLDLDSAKTWELLALTPEGPLRFPGPKPMSPITVGRDAACDVRLDLPFVANQEIRLSWTDEGFAIQDLGSRHGFRSSSSEVVRVGDRPALLLRPGDWVAVGTVTLIIATPGTPVPDADTDVLDVEFGELLRSPLTYDGEFIRTSGIWLTGDETSDFARAWIRHDDELELPSLGMGEVAAYWIDATGRWRFRSKADVERGRGFGHLGRSRGLMTIETLHHIAVAPKIYLLVPTADPSNALPVYIGGCILIGSHPRCHIVLDGSAQFHARIDVREDTVITDLGSVSGTHVNGFSIDRPTVLVGHDIIEIDGHQFSVEPLDFEREIVTRESEAASD